MKKSDEYQTLFLSFFFFCVCARLCAVGWGCFGVGGFDHTQVPRGAKIITSHKNNGEPLSWKTLSRQNISHTVDHLVFPPSIKVIDWMARIVQSVIYQLLASVVEPDGWTVLISPFLGH